MKLGDWVNFKNWEVSPQGEAEGWGGEFSLSLGEGAYFAHPLGLVTAAQIVGRLDEARIDALVAEAQR